MLRMSDGGALPPSTCDPVDSTFPVPISGAIHTLLNRWLNYSTTVVVRLVVVDEQLSCSSVIGARSVWRVRDDEKKPLGRRRGRIAVAEGLDRCVPRRRSKPPCKTILSAQETRFRPSSKNRALSVTATGFRGSLAAVRQFCQHYLPTSAPIRRQLNLGVASLSSLCP